MTELEKRALLEASNYGSDGFSDEPSYDKSFYDGYIKGYHDACQWQDASKTLPEPYERVLVRTANGELLTAEYNPTEGWFLAMENDSFTWCDNITEWRYVEEV